MRPGRGLVGRLASDEDKGAGVLLEAMLIQGSGGRIHTRQPLGRVPTVSVVVPCYNYGRYLRQCVGSVLDNQPGLEVEVIVVDDASTDDSLSIARSIAAEDHRVRVIAHGSNAGHIATYNDGLAAATGEFVLLISADDCVTPRALTRAAELLVAHPNVGLVYGQSIAFYGTLPPARTCGNRWILWSGNDWLRTRCISGYNVVASPEVVMRTALLREFGGYRNDLPHAGDFEMWLRTAARADIGYLIGVDQAYYRQHASNMNVRMFASGTPKGQLIDLEQRWLSFEAVFSGVGASVRNKPELHRIARRTLAGHALLLANYAYARGIRSFPIGAAEALANKIDCDIGASRIGRAFKRRKRLGMLPLPLHPLWAIPAILFRLKGAARRWRRDRVGI